MKVIGKLVLLAACYSFSTVTNAFMPMECTPTFKNNLAGENLAKRNDFKRWTFSSEERAMIYFINSDFPPSYIYAHPPERVAVHQNRKWALYRARDIFNKNSSGVKIQIIETSWTNPVTWGIPALTNNIQFRNKSEFPFNLRNAGGIAISFPCVF